MYLENELKLFMERLRGCDKLDGVKIIRAYPCVEKPTKLKTTVITVSPSEVNADSVSIGQNNIYASYTIDADIFTPAECGAAMMGEYIQAVLSSQLNSVPVSIAVSAVEADNRLACYKVKCSFTYNGELISDDIEEGLENNE